jgi:gp32 DNA binding protein like
MAQTTQDFDALFNPQINTGSETKSNSAEYQPTADKGKNKVYSSVIRFVTWWENPNHSINEKWVCWLVDPVTQRGKFIDCPSSVGKQSPLQDIYWKLKKSESVHLQKQAEVFSRRHNFAAIVQVVKDENAPELVGKLLIWRFGQKIHEKITSELKPVIGDPHNPFDLLQGKLFALHITKVSGFNNYDQSKFLDKVIPLCLLDDKGKNPKPINASTDKAMVFNYLKENTPDLKKYEYKDWDAETFDYVNHCIQAVTGQASVSPNYASVNNASKGANPVPSSKSNAGITSTNISVEDLNVDSFDSGMPNLDLPSLGDFDSGLPGDLSSALEGL